MSTRQKLGSKQAHRVIHQPAYPWSRSVVLVPGCTGWLAEISADLRKAVAHLRRVRDDALYKSTATLLYFAMPSYAVFASLSV